MAWVMHSEVRHCPWCLTFYIGSIKITEITFSDKRPFLVTKGHIYGPFSSVSSAMTEIHRLLNEPPQIEEPNQQET